MEMPRKRRGEALMALVLVIGLGWFYAWTVAPEGFADWAVKDSPGYYNLLSKGLLKGHLFLDRAADPFLAQVKDPWDPVQRGPHGMHDASYYRGHYYIYFGISPAVILFLPFRLLTGYFIDERAGVLVFAWVGLAASVGLLGSLRRRYFPEAATWAYLAGIVALGLVDMVPTLLRRPGIWEVPIACAYACFMVALWALDRAMRAERRLSWLGLGSLASGLAIGARPDYLPACLTVLIIGWALAREAGGGFTAWGQPRWRRTLGAALGPLAGVGVGLALYNWLRFGSIAEFGQRYQMSGSNAEHLQSTFGWSFLVYGFRLYWLEPAGWSHFFPYVLPITPPPAPAGMLGIEDPYGILPNFPYVAWTLGLAAWAAWRVRSGTTHLRVWLLGVSLGVVGAMVTVTAYGGFTNRYMVDFLPGLVVVGAIGLLAFSARIEPQVWRGRAAAVFTGGLLLYSSVFGVLASVRHNELLRVEHPAVYARLAHRGNWPSYLWDRWRHTSYGPVEIKVIFPRHAAGTNEPLVVTGWGWLADYLIVHYEAQDQVQFGLIHTSGALLLGNLMHVEPGVVHTLRFDLGSLYPPAAHPYFDAMGAVAARLRTHTFAVNVDGELQFARHADFYDAVSPRPSIGAADGRPAYAEPFSGRIVSWRRLPGAPPDPLEQAALGSGPLRIDLEFPPFAGERSEPLLSTGSSGRGDLVYVRYLSATRVAFGYDHWSAGGPISHAVEIDPGVAQVVEIDTAAINGKNPGRLILRLNGQTVFDRPEPCYPCAPDTVAVGLNAIRASTAAEAFSGRILWTRRSAP
jgi:hypothetical protein